MSSCLECMLVMHVWGVIAGGPVVSYLMDALQLPNFRLQDNTKVLSVLRNGSEVTGVHAEVGGTVEEYMAARVVLAAGVFFLLSPQSHGM